MYPTILAIHNIMRWVVLLLGVWALVSAFSGLALSRTWTESDRRPGSLFTISLDIQLLLGLLLYFVLSPITRLAMSDFGAAMGDDVQRFYAVEHLMMMILGIVFAHIGNVRVKRSSEGTTKFRTAAIWYTLAFVAILSRIPWDRAFIPSF
ncbi:hypothetical protein KFU94_70010 [Chloroflexi bacterium TSY]|nr:hypothetical protein [Chloroflexi bacterium TSY]